MVHALRETHRISRQVGDNPLLAARRVHLVHNIMKGGSRGAVDHRCPSGRIRDSPLLGRGARGLAIRIGSGPECRPDPPIAREELPAQKRGDYDPEIKRLASCPQPPSPRAWDWLSLKRWQIEGRIREFLGEAVPFLNKGPGTTPNLWYAIALDVLVLCSTQEPSRTQRAPMAAMATTMLTSSAVPPFVRTQVDRLAFHHGRCDDEVSAIRAARADPARRSTGKRPAPSRPPPGPRPGSSGHEG